MAYGEALSALSDPTRRALFERVREEPLSVNDLTESAGVSQPAVSQHLKVLREAGLVSYTQAGTKRLYRADLEGLASLRAYVESLWDDVLTAFADDQEPDHERIDR